MDNTIPTVLTIFGIINFIFMFFWYLFLNIPEINLWVALYVPPPGHTSELDGYF